MANNKSTSTEGELDFHYPAANKACKTWYRIYGDLSKATPTPLITLHGGPGMTSGYLTPLEDLYERYGIPVIIYDQLGCGKSTHLPQRKGDTEFWTAELFIAELENLISKLNIRESGTKDFNLYGQSWGGMLGSLYASRHPRGLRKLILSNSPASMDLWLESCNGLRKHLPQHVQDALDKGEREKDYDSKDFEDAVMQFYKHHLCRVEPFPQVLMDIFDQIKEDPTVYHTMNGPSEFTVVGSLKTWNTTEESKKIDVPTLLINGQHDEGQISCVAPFFSSIPKVRWITMDRCSHLPMFEDRDRYIEIMGEFLKD